MKVNPEHYCMRFVGVSVPAPHRSKAERLESVKKVLSESLALSVLRMDRFIDVGLTDQGDEQHVLELFVFTRAELNQLMESVAESTAQYLTGGSKRN